jgi:anti-sigma regulatory factor (Ser/Thr protein kinase)
VGVVNRPAADGAPPNPTRCSLAGVPVAVDHESDVARLRRRAAEVADELAMRRAERDRVELIVTEMATNLLKFAVRGTVVVQPVQQDGRTGIDVVSVDHGPGMDDAWARTADGYSTSGTLGGGLGAIMRLSDDGDLYSLPDVGTVVFGRVWKSRSRRPEPAFAIGALGTPHPDETVSGDGWAWGTRPPGLAIGMIDGLGHGPGAAAAAKAALDALRLGDRDDPEVVLRRVHEALRGTRGAAASVAEVDTGRGRVRGCGVGNVVVRVESPQRTGHLLSEFGVLGLNARFKTFEEPWPADGLLVAHSDGLSARWTLSEFPDLERHHPTVIAATIWRKAARTTDDASILVVKGAP